VNDGVGALASGVDDIGIIDLADQGLITPGPQRRGLLGAAGETGDGVSASLEQFADRGADVACGSCYKDVHRYECNNGAGVEPSGKVKKCTQSKNAGPKAMRP